MNSIRLVSLWLLASIASIRVIGLQTPDFLWARSAGGTNYDYAQILRVDKSGNVIVTGSFLSETLTLGAVTLTNRFPPNSDFFLAKYDPAGNVLWARSGGGTGNDDTYGLTVDDLGNIYLSGTFDSTNFIFGGQSLGSVGGSDAFIAKLDSSGNPLWARQGGGAKTDWGYAVAVDSSGQHIFLAGAFLSTNANFGGQSLTNGLFGSELFVVKYDAEGNVVWARQAVGNSDDLVWTAAADASGNLVVGAYYSSTNLSIGNLQFTNASVGATADLLLAKYDPVGNLLWAKRAGGSGYDRPEDLTLDAGGNIYVVGYFNSSNAVFGNFVITNNTPNVARVFTAKYDPAGTVLWARSLDATNGGTLHRIAVDITRNVYLAGSFSGIATFGTNTLTASGAYDPYIAMCGPDGTPLWGKRAGGSSTDYASGVGVDGSGNIYVAGYFSSNDASWDTISLPNSGRNDMFVARIGYVQPPLSIVRSGSYIVLFWSDAFPTFTVQTSTNFAGNSWCTLDSPPVQILNQMIVVEPLLPGNRFYRLKH